MDILIDTCVIIWAALAPSKISKTARNTLLSSGAVVRVASVSVAEVARLAEKKRIEVKPHWKPWLRKVVKSNGWHVLPATYEIMEEAYSLPGEFHSDPADRILVATARLHSLTLITADRRILDYPNVPSLW